MVFFRTRGLPIARLMLPSAALESTPPGRPLVAPCFVPYEAPLQRGVLVDRRDRFIASVRTPRVTIFIRDQKSVCASRVVRSVLLIIIWLRHLAALAV